jgi:hypothetical protein
MWISQSNHLARDLMLDELASLPWPDPYSVQVLVQQEEDDCFGLWMLYDGKFEEVQIPRTTRHFDLGLDKIDALERVDNPDSGF